MSSVPVKVFVENAGIRVAILRLPPLGSVWATARTAIRQVAGLDAEIAAVKYHDSVDAVTIGSQAEWEECLRIAAAAAGETDPLCLTVHLVPYASSEGSSSHEVIPSPPSSVVPSAPPSTRTDAGSQESRQTVPAGSETSAGTARQADLVVDQRRQQEGMQRELTALRARVEDLQAAPRFLPRKVIMAAVVVVVACYFSDMGRSASQNAVSILKPPPTTKGGVLEGCEAQELDNMADGEQNAASKSNEAALTEGLATCKERLTQIEMRYEALERDKKAVDGQIAEFKANVTASRNAQERPAEPDSQLLAILTGGPELWRSVLLSSILTSPRELYLQGSGCGHACITVAIDVINANHNLEVIIFWGNSIGDKGVKAVAECLKGNQKVVKVDLEGNGIGNEGAKALATVLRENTIIRRIDLGFNSISNEGFAVLAHAIAANPKSAVVYISFLYNEIDSAFARPLIDAVRSKHAVQFEM